MSIIAAVFNVAFIAFISYHVWFKDHSRIKSVFWPALALKLLAGIGLGLVYTYYYTVGDTFAYFNDGVRLAELARKDPGSYAGFLWSGNESHPIWQELIYKQPRAMFLSKVTSVFCVLSVDNYWVVSLYFSAISFFSTWVLAKKIMVLNPDAKVAVVLGFFFFPSVVFWSSGIIKESLATAALLFLCFIFLRLWMRESIRPMEWPVAILSMWFLWNLKYYYLAVFLPVAVTTLVVRWVFPRMRLTSLSLKIIVWSFIFVGPLLFVSILHPNFYPERFMDVVVSSYYEFHDISEGEDIIHFHSLEATPLSLLQNVPLAIISGLYRPFVTEAQTIFQFLIAIENLALFILTIAALTRIKQVVRSRHRLLLFSLTIYIVVLCVFLTLSTPNFGTLSRYRVGFLPFLALLVTLENPLVVRFMNSKWLRDLAP